MKRTFRIKLENEELSVSVERQGDQLVVERDGRSYVVTPVEDDSRRASYARTSVGGSPGRGGTAAGSSAEPLATARPADEAHPAASSATAKPAPQGAIPAPVTGTIKEVLANVGDTVSEGERVMMMEAMKMDIEILTPASGKVKEVFVKAGDSVKENQPLFSID